MTGFAARLLRRLVLTAVAALALAGCSTFGSSKSPPPCPPVSVLADAGSFTRFRAGEGRDITDVELQGEITGFNGSCKYDKDAHRLDVTLQVEMTFTRGPAANGRDAVAQYFVAVPAFRPKPQAKQVLGVRFAFSGAADHVRITDNQVIVSLPVKDLNQSLDPLAIYIGFQLDPAELDYNRRNKGPP